MREELNSKIHDMSVAKLKAAQHLSSNLYLC